MVGMKISIIIPAYNEEEDIKELLPRLVGLYPDYEIIVVDDGSTDDTGSIASDMGIKVFSHPYNKGNGAAVKSGIRIATGNVLVFMDGDNQHDPEDIADLIRYIPEYDMVVGARNRKGQTSALRWIGNSIYNRLASYVAKFQVKDLTSGFRAVKKDIAMKFLSMLPNSYSYPTTITLGMLRNGFSIKYIPINMKKGEKGKSNIKLFQDGVRFLMIIIKICTLYSPMRIFMPVSFLMFFLGLIRYIYTFILYRSFTNMSAMLMIGSIIIFMMGLVSEQICQIRYDRSEGM